MREIKFRLWREEYMVEGSDSYEWWIDFGGLVSYDGNPQDLEKSGYVLMQYTGLKDKNGKEVFEGDIVKTEHQSIGICVWLEEEVRFGFNCKEPLWSHPIYGMSGEKEIIGNIYENPELLK